MKQVLVAACVGITVGWMGFGWVLAEAPADKAVGEIAQIEAPVEAGVLMTAGVDILQEQQVSSRVVHETAAVEPNLRG